MATVNNSRIAKNTVYLYSRTLVVLVVSLYTSRLVLQILGVTGLGIYNVVAGIVALLAFLQSAQAKATSRFITYELGANADAARLRRIFSVCMTIHILIALVVILFGETLGLWMIYHWISVPPERFTAALWVYQFAIVAFALQIIRVPYDSVIIAQENMSVYAYMSILEAALKLGVVIALLHSTADRLVLYGAFLAVIALILLVIYSIYVRHRYPENRFSFTWDKENSPRIVSFSGWAITGNLTNTATQQGVNLLLNNFVGLVANAALGFANQVNAALAAFVINLTTAFNPQIVKLYAQQDNVALYTLMNRASKFSFALCYVMALPLIINMDFILHVWLGEVPQYTTEFCQLILVCTVIDATTSIYNIAITATGNIRRYQLCISVSFLLDLLCSFILLSLHINPALVFASRILTRGVINMFIGQYFCRRLISFPLKEHIRKVLVPALLTVLISVPIVYVVSTLSVSWLRLITTTLLTLFIVLFSTLYIIMNNHERCAVMEKISMKIRR